MQDDWVFVRLLARRATRRYVQCDPFQSDVTGECAADYEQRNMLETLLHERPDGSLDEQAARAYLTRCINNRAKQQHRRRLRPHLECQSLTCETTGAVLEPADPYDMEEELACRQMVARLRRMLSHDDMAQLERIAESRALIDLYDPAREHVRTFYRRNRALLTRARRIVEGASQC